LNCVSLANDCVLITNTLWCCFDLMRRHVLSVHSSASRPQSIARGAAAGAAAAGAATAGGASDVVREGEPPIDEKTLKRFIHYARTHCFPRLEEQSAGRLVAKFVELRDKVGVGVAVSLQTRVESLSFTLETSSAFLCCLLCYWGKRMLAPAQHVGRADNLRVLCCCVCRRVRRVLLQTPASSAPSL
jgi:hypothetical protein